MTSTALSSMMWICFRRMTATCIPVRSSRATCPWPLMSSNTTSEADCDLSGCKIRLLEFYQELGCAAVTPEGAYCPTSFDCSAVLAAHDPSKCSHRGQLYEEGATLSSEASAAECLVLCRCRRIDATNRSEFQCAHIDCPEFLGYDLPLEEGCVQTYSSLDSCCYDSTYCEPEGKEGGPTCEHGGRSYRVGEKFYPEEFPCRTCLCLEGYDGSLGAPWCRDVSCGLLMFGADRLLDGCAPVYYGDRCCPVDWRCPSDRDTVERADPDNATLGTEGLQCQFGALTLDVGDLLAPPRGSCTTCQCATPPMLTCVQGSHEECPSL